MEDIKKPNNTVTKEQEESTNNQTTRKPTTRKKPSDTVTKKSDTVTKDQKDGANAQITRKPITRKKPSDTVTKKSDTVTKQKMTAAERQKRYREKNNNLCRLDMTISQETDELLNRLTAYYRVTKKELIAKLAQEANQKIIDDMRKQEKKDKSFNSSKAIDHFIMLTEPKLF